MNRPCPRTGSSSLRLLCVPLLCLLLQARAELLPERVPDASLATMPYAAVGMVRTDFNGPDAAVAGSGAAVGDKVVLTAAHVFFEPDIKGWNRSGWHWQSTPTSSNLMSWSSELTPRSYRVLAGYAEEAGKDIDATKSFELDTLALVFYQSVSSGNMLKPSLLSLNQTGSKFAIGYPAELHEKQLEFGNPYAHAASSAAFTARENSPVLSHSKDLVVGSGMSGGPVCVEKDGSWTLGGVVVAKTRGDDRLIARQVDAKAGELITQAVADTAPGLPGNLYWSTKGSAALALSDGGFFLQKEGRLLRLKEDGSVLWDQPGSNSEELLEMPDGSLVSGDLGRLTFLDRTTGLPLRTIGAYPHNAPCVSEDGILYLYNSSLGKLQAHLNGTLLWEINPVPPDPAQTGFSVITGPILGLDGSLLLLINSRLYSFNPDGQFSWRSEPLTRQNGQAFAVAPSGDIIVGAGPTLFAFRPNGEQRWSVTLPFTEVVRLAAISSEGNIYVQSNYLLPNTPTYLISADGTLKGTLPASEGTLLALTKDGGWISCGYDGTIRAQDSTGKVLWQSPGYFPIVAFGAQSQVLLGRTNDSRVPTYSAISTHTVLDPGAWIGVQGGQNASRRSPFSRPVAPAIVKGPESQTVVLGTLLSLTAEVRGSQVLRYEWYKDGKLLPEQVGSRLQLPAVTEADAGAYTVKVLNPAGSVVSAPAQIKVINSQAGMALWHSTRLTLSQPSFGHDGTLYVVVLGNNPGVDDKKALLTAFSPGGLEQWSQALEAQYLQSSDLRYRAPLVTDDGTVCIGSKGFTYAFTASGKLRWKLTSATTGDTETTMLALGRNGDLFAIEDDQLLCIEITTGRIRWQKPCGKLYASNMRVTKEGNLHVSSNFFKQGYDMQMFTPDGALQWSIEGSTLGLIQADGSFLCPTSLLAPAYPDQDNSLLVYKDAIAVHSPDGTLRYTFLGRPSASMVINKQGDIITSSGMAHPFTGAKAINLFKGGLEASLVGVMEDESICFSANTNEGAELRYYTPDSRLAHTIRVNQATKWTPGPDGRLVGGNPLEAYQGYSLPAKSAWPLPLADAQATLRAPLSPETAPADNSVRPGLSLGSKTYLGYDLVLTHYPEGSGILGFQWQFNEVDIPGATATNLRIPTAQAGNNGRYRLIVQTGSGPIVSETLTVSLKQPDPITPGFYTGHVLQNGNRLPFAAVVDNSRHCTYFPSRSWDGNTSTGLIGPDGMLQLLPPSSYGGMEIPLNLFFTPRLSSVEGYTSPDLELDPPQTLPGLLPTPGVYRARNQSLSRPNIHAILGPNGKVYFSMYEARLSGWNAIPPLHLTGDLAPGSRSATLSSADGTATVRLDFAEDQRCEIQITITGAEPMTRRIHAITTDRAPREFLSNLSTRGLVNQGPMTSGFVIEGSAPQPMLIRGIGPALKGFGLANALNRPSLELFNSQGSRVEANAGWSLQANAADLAEATHRLGGFALQDKSADAALWTTLQPGLYTASVTAGGTDSGISLIEAYDGQSAATRRNRLVNLSTRGRAGSGENALIAGLVIEGNASKTLLVRGVGPSLNAFLPASTVCQNTRLSIVDTKGNTVATNDDWTYESQNQFAVEAVSAKVGAFALQQKKDAALLVTLDPGSYTILVSCDPGMEGTSLVEIYEVPADF